MSETYIKAEIITPKWTADKWVSKIYQALLSTAVSVLILWWFFAAWFPQLGLTYWQLVLPFYAARVVFSGSKFVPRQLTR